jgi:hypothetical protein
VAWVVDTCLLIDVAVADPTFGNASARLLDARQAAGLVLCPVTYIELAPVFAGDRTASWQGTRAKEGSPLIGPVSTVQPAAGRGDGPQAHPHPGRLARRWRPLWESAGSPGSSRVNPQAMVKRTDSKENFMVA